MIRTIIRPTRIFICASSRPLLYILEARLIIEFQYKKINKNCVYDSKSFWDAKYKIFKWKINKITLIQRRKKHKFSNISEL